MPLEPELLQKIKKKRLDEVEAAWVARADESPRSLGWFLEVARELRGVKAHVRMAELLILLADVLAESGAFEEALDALLEGLSLSPRSRELREKGLETLRAQYADRSNLDESLTYFDLAASEDPVRTLGELRHWLRFQEGEGFWLFGRGLGKVADVNLALQKVRLRFEKASPLVMRRDEAQKILTWIPSDHFMMRRLEDPKGVGKEARADPGEIIRQLLTCFGKPLTSAEVRECMTGVVEGGAWAAWWTKARSNERVVPSQKKKGAIAWMESTEKAEEQVLQEFHNARGADRLRLARRHGKRGGAVMEAIRVGLEEDLAREAPLGSSEALEVAMLLDELGGNSGRFSVPDMLRSEEAAERIAEVGERRFRERLYRMLREVRPEDWTGVARRAFFLETDLRLISAIYESLLEEDPEDAVRLVTEACATPKKGPAAFVWSVKHSLRREELSARASTGLLSKVAEALDEPEFRDLKQHLREQFDEGGLAFVVFEGTDFESADHLLTLIDGAALEDHRKTGIRRAIFRRHPHIRKRSGQDDVLWATSEAAEAKRAELHRIVREEIPQATEAIATAREFGDLSENFEYHAARQKHEVLSTRAARLEKEIRMVRLIDAGAVDPATVGVGVRVHLLPAEGGPERELVILGPWESDPDGGVVSYASDMAKRMLGKRPGEGVGLDGREYTIARLTVWRTPVSSAGTPPGGPMSAPVLY